MRQATALETFRAAQPLQAERTYVLLVSIFLGVLLITNVITVKYITIAKVTLTAGAITYPFTFSLIDIIAELYGKKRAQLAVWMGLLVSLFMILIVQLASLLPTYSQSPISQPVFQQVFGFTPGIVLGSMVAYLVAQFADIYLFDWFSRLTKHKYLWLRNNVSTFISQLLDTLIFGWIAWVGWPLLGINDAIAAIEWATWYPIVVNEYLFKLAFSVLNTPLVYLGVYAARFWTRP